MFFFFITRSISLKKIAYKHLPAIADFSRNQITGSIAFVYKRLLRLNQVSVDLKELVPPSHVESNVRRPDRTATQASVMDSNF